MSPAPFKQCLNGAGDINTNKNNITYYYVKFNITIPHTLNPHLKYYRFMYIGLERFELSRTGSKCQ